MAFEEEMYRVKAIAGFRSLVDLIDLDGKAKGAVIFGASRANDHIKWLAQHTHPKEAAALLEHVRLSGKEIIEHEQVAEAIRDFARLRGCWTNPDEVRSLIAVYLVEVTRVFRLRRREEI